MAKHGEFSHIEFPATDLERAKAFYGNVFGWQFEKMDGFDNYWLYTAGPGDLGGGFGLRGDTAPDQVRNYLRVDSVDASLDDGDRERRDARHARRPTSGSAGTRQSRTPRATRSRSGSRARGLTLGLRAYASMPLCA